MRFVDANIFIYVLTKSPKHEFQTSVNILERIKSGEDAIVTTPIVQQVADWLEYNGRRNAIPTFLASLNSYVRLRKVGCTWADMLKALDYLKDYQVSFIDATTLAVMERLKEKEVYSNDTDFDKVKWVKRIFA